MKMLMPIGAGALVGGLLAFAFGIALGIGTSIHTGVAGLVWNGGDYCFFGALLAAAGAASLTAGIRATRSA